MKDLIDKLFALILEKYQNNKKVLAIILAILAIVYCVLTFTSCGITRATISRPSEGTSTTITITTNNPITTNVDPTINAEYKPLKDN